MWHRHAASPSGSGLPVLNVEAIRRHFDFPATGRVVTNNAASTQPPRELLELYRSLTPGTRTCTADSRRPRGGRPQLFEESYDTIATWLNAPSRRSIATYRNTTEAINAVMYSLLTEFRDGDNVVTTMMEHNSNFVPWYALCREILPRFGRRVECRVARFDHRTGAARPGPPRRAGRRADQARLRHRRVELPRHQAAAAASSGRSPTAAGTCSRDGRAGSLLLVDAAQLVPSSLRRRAAARRRLPGLLLPQDCSRRSASACSTRRSTCSRQAAAVPLRRRHDRRGPGRAGSGGVQRPAVEVRRRHAEHPRRDRLRAGAATACSTWSARTVRRAGSTTTQPLPRATVVALTMDRVAQHTAALTERALHAAHDDRRAHRVRAGARHAALAAARVQRDRHRPDALADALDALTASSLAPAATARPSPTATSA